MNLPITNPFRPGAGHMPPYLAGRQDEEEEFRSLLKQDPIMDNLILTGLRGVGKTVLLETLRPIAVQQKWAWVGSDLSESAAVSEESLAIRLLTDMSVFTATLSIPVTIERIGLTGPHKDIQPLSYAHLLQIYVSTPGLAADRLKAVLSFVWKVLDANQIRGMVFAYDEAQILHDSAHKDQYPLSVLLEVFQSIQRQGMRMLLVLTGLPTLFPKLVEARTYSERMFHQVFLQALTPEASRDAITIPTESGDCHYRFSEATIQAITEFSGGYPYFIQFICKELFDVLIQTGRTKAIPLDNIILKLDSDFFAGRWARATDRQRDLLRIIATLPNCETEFSVQEIVERSKIAGSKPFTSSHVHQMLSSLSEAGLVFRNRHGRYSFAVPLLDQFIARQPEP